MLFQTNICKNHCIKIRSANYVQLNDINAAPTYSWFPDTLGGYYGWLPIASDSFFSGTYYGRGFIIDSLYINRASGGMFCTLKGPGANAEGIILKNILINSMGDAGGIAAQCFEVSGIVCCSVS